MAPEQLLTVLQDTATALGVPGATVGIWHEDAARFAHHGVTSLDNPLPVDVRTLFLAGSITKTYTATAVMRLVEAGRIDMDAPVRTYLPGLQLSDPDVAAAVTTRQLLNHTAGWRGDFIDDTGDGDDALASYVERMRGLPRLHPPGELASYNNAAFNLAGHLVACVTGQTYEAAVRCLVLEPLSLRDSTFLPREVMLRRFAVGHVEREGVARPAETWGLARSGNPSGGLATTAGDLLRFALLHLRDGRAADGQALLSPKAAAAMRTATAPMGEHHVGIGWSLARIGDTQLVSHGGSTPGQEALLTLSPDHGFAIAVLTNSASGLQLCGQMTQWALEAYLGLVPPAPVPLDVTPEDLRAYEGRYDGGLYVLTLAAQDTRLVADLTLTEDGRAQLTAAGVDTPALAGSHVQLLAGDRFLIVDGPYGGQTGGILRGDDDAVDALELGRVLPRLR